MMPKPSLRNNYAEQIAWGKQHFYRLLGFMGKLEGWNPE